MGKIIIGLLILMLLALAGNVIFEKFYPYPRQIKYGVTFSPRYARYLKLDWQKTYLMALDDLQIRHFRIPGYWDILEQNKGKYDFTETDYVLNEASKRGAKIVLVLGMRQPRWPECHIPSWAKGLTLEERRQQVLQFIQQVVERYKNHPVIEAWQVENEPFLQFFGEGCDPADANFLQVEVNLVKNLSSKPVIVTDSGELGLWNVPMQLSDVFGTTLYRDVYNPVMGYFTYPVLPYFYNLHSQIIKKIFAPNNKKTIVIELQAEPWFGSGEPSQLSVSKMQYYVKFAQQTGFDEIYLWGVEWWYYMAAKGHPEYLNYAKTLY